MSASAESCADPVREPSSFCLCFVVAIEARSLEEAEARGLWLVESLPLPGWVEEMRLRSTEPAG